MQGAVENDAVEFRLKGCCLGFGVITHPVEADVDFCRDLGRLRKIKGDDVGVVVVVQKLPIDLQNAFVGAEDIIHRLKLLSLSLEKFFDECLQSGSIAQAN